LLRLVSDEAYSGEAWDESYLLAVYQVDDLDPSVAAVREVVRTIEDLALVDARDVFGSKGDCNRRRVEDRSLGSVVVMVVVVVVASESPN
jgi:hypothetical protein